MCNRTANFFASELRDGQAPSGDILKLKLCATPAGCVRCRGDATIDIRSDRQAPALKYHEAARFYDLVKRPRRAPPMNRPANSVADPGGFDHVCLVEWVVVGRHQVLFSMANLCNPCGARGQPGTSTAEGEFLFFRGASWDEDAHDEKTFHFVPFGTCVLRVFGFLFDLVVGPGCR